MVTDTTTQHRTAPHPLGGAIRTCRVDELLGGETIRFASGVEVIEVTATTWTPSLRPVANYSGDVALAVNLYGERVTFLGPHAGKCRANVAEQVANRWFRVPRQTTAFVFAEAAR